MGGAYAASPRLLCPLGVFLGRSPAQTDPNTEHVKKALNSLEFLVVQEIFMSETAKFANVVLPGASFFEKSGIFTNGECRVQRVNEVIPPLAGMKTHPSQNNYLTESARASTLAPSATASGA